MAGSAARDDDGVMIKPFLLALLPLLAVAASPAPAKLRESAVRLGETAHVGGPRVRPLRVIEDSRCPMNARCIRAGDVTVRALVITGRRSRTMDLTLGKRVPLADGSLGLVSVNPGRMAGKPIAPAAYRFVFDFQGGL